MRNFLRRLFPPPSKLLRVSVVMDRGLFARLNRLARHAEVPGDGIIDLAVREFLAKHERPLLDGDEGFSVTREITN